MLIFTIPDLIPAQVKCPFHYYSKNTKKMITAINADLKY